MFQRVKTTNVIDITETPCIQSKTIYSTGDMLHSIIFGKVLFFE